MDNVKADVVARLQALCKSDEAFKRLFEWSANRQNDATQTAIDYLAFRAGTDRRRAIEMARELEELGCGRFLVGRRGAKSRIIWEISLKSIGLAATGKAKTVESLDPDLKDETVGLEDDGASSAPLTIIEAKKRLAKTFGVTPEAIEITVRA
jgi:hypothetical protein